MPWTAEAIEAPKLGQTIQEPNQFDLPSKEFVGYDPKGTTTVTGSQKAAAESENPQQPNTNIEGKEVAESPPTEESVTLSPKLSALARKEQAQRQREQALLKREKELEAKLADAEKYQQLRTKLEAKDYSAADDLGISYEEFLNHELKKQASANPEEQRFKKVEEEISNFKKAQEEREVQEYQANQAAWKQEISKLVSEGDEFSTIKELNAEAIVLQHVNDSFEEDGIELTAEQAAKEIEAALIERAEKFSSVSKIKNKSQEGKVLGPPKTSTKTITQNMTTTSVKPSSKPFHLMSESEQIAEAYRRVQAEKLQR